MRRFPARVLIAYLLSVAAAAPIAGQQSPAGSKNSVPPQGTTVLHTGTQLVVVDVVVQDQNGHPVHGLTKDSFQLLDSKTPQQVRSFEEHTSAAPQPSGPEMPPLPPGIFTDYTAVPPNGTLNILLLDTLNTPMKDQTFVRTQLQQYVTHADPGTRVAIFGLTTRLIFLQGFTSDPKTLKDAVDHKLIPRASVLLDDPTGSNADIQSLADMESKMGPGLAQAAANLQEVEEQRKAFDLRVRQQYTLDAFNQLAHYLASFPGRKNVIWFSGGFPLNILPNPSLKNPFGSMESDNEEFRETANLLTRAQVAVYPVDARGLMTASVLDPANSGGKYVNDPNAFANDIARSGSALAAEHGTMEQLADNTGGHAYFNTNGLADAVAKAIGSGSNYYTLTYSPSNTKWQGEYREIRVNLTGALATRGLQLAYRHGYNADDPNQPHKEAKAASVAEAAASATRTAGAYAAAALGRGAPTPEDILFKVRVLPASKSEEDTVAPGNQLDPTGRTKGPFRRFDVDFAAVSSDFQLTQQTDGLYTGMIEFIAYVYDPDGKLLNVMGNSLHLSLKPETYRQFQHQSMPFHLQVSAPVRRESYLRIAIHDVPSNRFGVVEIPTSSVGRLEPAVYPEPAAPPTKMTPSPSVPH